MSNGFGPLLPYLNTIRYSGPCGECHREYWLGSSHTTYEDYVDIKGLDPNQLAGPWGSRELDSEHGCVTLPREVAFKIAAAILRSAANHTEGWNGEKPCWVCESGVDHDTLIKLLDGILRDELDPDRAHELGLPLDF